MSSFKYNNVFIKDYESIVGPLEANGNLKYSNTIEDYYYNEDKIEDAEIKMQNFCLNKILKRNNINNKTDIIIGGDLIDQISVTSYNLINRNIPFLGIYNACATFNESLILLANFIENGNIKNGIAITSSHNLNAERQYRYPIEYGNQKKIYSTFTTTAAVCALLTPEKTNIKVESSTIGTVVDYGIKDSSNMGAIMAPSACNTLVNHLKELKRTINYYDIIITGDLGKIGSQIFLKLLKEEYNIQPKLYMDAASIIYKETQEETLQGGSGPTVLPVVLFNKILNEKKYKKVLLLATGSLHSPLMVNLKKTIPSITHAISLEVNI